MASPANRDDPHNRRQVLPASGGATNRPPPGLAEIMKLGLEAKAPWRPEELCAVLEYHLAAPWQFDLGGLDARDAARLKSLSAAEGLLLRSLRDLFHHPHPPLELLRLMQRFAKAQIEDANSLWPSEVARLIYYACIAVALLRCQTRISRLSNGQLCCAFDWALGQSWIDDASRKLFAEARQQIG